MSNLGTTQSQAKIRTRCDLAIVTPARYYTPRRVGEPGSTTTRRSIREDRCKSMRHCNCFFRIATRLRFDRRVTLAGLPCDSHSTHAESHDGRITVASQLQPLHSGLADIFAKVARYQLHLPTLVTDKKFLSTTCQSKHAE